MASWLTGYDVTMLGNKRDVMFQMLGCFDVIGQRHTLTTFVTHNPFLPFHGSQRQKTTWRRPRHNRACHEKKNGNRLEDFEKVNGRGQ